MRGECAECEAFPSKGKAKGASRTPPPTPYIVFDTDVVGAVYATATVGDKRLPPATIAPVWSPVNTNVWHKFRAYINKKRVFYKTIGGRIFVLFPIE